jgi:membrane protein implicated in regulation of membrane protease activity
MNKKLNTTLFLLGATLFNILVTILSFVLLLIIYARFIMPHLPDGGQAWAIVLVFIAAIAVSFVAYRFAMKVLMKKIPVEKYFDPLFGGKRRPPK